MPSAVTVSTGFSANVFTHDYSKRKCPFCRFLKRDSDTGAWEDVGDDVAREKASQVLRDAVALLPEEKEQDPTEPLPIDSVETKPYPSAVASVPVSVDESERAQSAYSQRQTPILAHHSTELPVPTPVTSYRKRRRHYYGYEGYQPDDVQSPIHSPTRRRYDAYHHHHHSYPPYHTQSTRRRPPPPPHYYDPYGHPGAHIEPTLPLSHSELARQHQHQTNRRPAAVSAGARQASTASAQSLLGQLESGMNEFDLFNGELIESDNEEQKGGRALPRGSL